MLLGMVVKDGETRPGDSSGPIAGVAMLLIVLGACLWWVVVRKEPDDFHFVITAFFALVGLLGLALPIVLYCGTRRPLIPFVLATGLLIGVVAVCLVEVLDDSIHWGRSVESFEATASAGSLPCDAETCELGNWTATSVVEMRTLTAVFADHEPCYAGFGFLKPSSPGLTVDDAESALTSFGLGFADVDPWRDGWMRFCITT